MKARRGGSARGSTTRGGSWKSEEDAVRGSTIGGRRCKSEEDAVNRHTLAGESNVALVSLKRGQLSIQVVMLSRRHHIVDGCMDGYLLFQHGRLAWPDVDAVSSIPYVQQTQRSTLTGMADFWDRAPGSSLVKSNAATSTSHWNSLRLT